MRGGLGGGRLRQSAELRLALYGRSWLPCTAWRAWQWCTIVTATPHGAVAGASLHLQQRVVHLVTTDAEAGSSASTSSLKKQVSSAKALEALFVQQPIAERIAAVFIARQELDMAARHEKTAAAAVSIPYAMPLKDFITAMPSITRDAIFREYQCGVLSWINRTRLLDIVDAEGHQLALEDLSSPSCTAEATSPTAVPSGTYGAIPHVRLVAKPEWILAAVGDAKVLVQEQERTVPQRLRGLGGEGVDDDVVQRAIIAALQRDGAELDAPQGSEGCSADAAAAADDGGTPVGVVKKSKAPAYMALSTVYHAVTTTTGGEDHAFTREESRCLKRLPFEVVESHIQQHSISVNPGTTMTSNEANTPSIASRPFWLVKVSSTLSPVAYVALRRAGEDQPPRFSCAQPRVSTTNDLNNYGGWGSATTVPLRQDVYEILRYIPVNWGNFGLINIPPAVKKKHIRVSSSLQWFRRQPWYFELRNMNGTTEIRRSIALHPEAHGMTREEAMEQVELRMATGEINSLIPLGADGQPLNFEESAAERAAYKFLGRVCPPYFAPLGLVMQRYTKKNLSEAALLALAVKRPQEYEVLSPRYSDVPLVRRRVGADSVRWRDSFVEDLERYPEDVRGIIVLCNRLCPSWDRPEYVYVRLSAMEQQLMDGYAGMMGLLRRHPQIFRTGQHFVCRADLSDPLAMQETEPAVDDVTARSILREENPYLTPMDIALVFHYLAPEDAACTASYFVDCASPVMRAALPPRVVQIIQQFPRLFACTETSPGCYSIRKLRPARQIGMGASTTVATSSTTEMATAEQAGLADLEEELAEGDHLSRDQLVDAVKMLIPDDGVEAPQLLLWASMNVQRAASEYFGGLLRMVETQPTHFKVVITEETKMVYKVV